MWIHVPTSFLSAQGAEDSILDSDLLFQMLEQSATWKTKSLPAASWLKTWEKAGWTTRLFGQTYNRSMRNRGVTSWILSLAVIRASHLVTLEKDLEKKTQGIFGLTCEELWMKFNLLCASSKTSVLICSEDSVKSPEAYKQWATKLRQACLQRRKSARLTVENDYLSLLPTVTAREHNDSSKGKILASLDNGSGVAKRICRLSPVLRSSEEIVFLNPLFAEWMMGWPKGWVTSGSAAATKSTFSGTA